MVRITDSHTETHTKTQTNQLKHYFKIQGTFKRVIPLKIQFQKFGLKTILSPIYGL